MLMKVYKVEAKDSSVERLQEFVGGVATGDNKIKIDRTFALNETVEAHRYMESNKATGKLVYHDRSFSLLNVILRHPAAPGLHVAWCC